MNDKFMKEMELVWGKSQKMIDFCVKESFEVIELESGHIYSIDKPRIETTFCFGCGQFGSATDEEMEFASERERNVHKFENFRNSNIESNFGNLIKELEDECGYIIKYTGGSNLVSIINKRSFNFEWAIENNKIVAMMTKSDKEKLREALNRAIARFDKRLQTYWKKYKDTKLKTWTYITD